MKGKLALFLCTLTFLLGCSSVTTSPDTQAKPVDKPIPEAQQPQPQPTSHDDQPAEFLSDVNKPFEVGHWRITLKPKVDDPEWKDFDKFKVDCTYIGNSKVTHATISFGNGIAKLHDIKPGEGCGMTSTFPLDTKSIDFSITSTEENGETVIQSRVLMTGQ